MDALEDAIARVDGGLWAQGNYEECLHVYMQAASRFQQQEAKLALVLQAINASVNTRHAKAFMLRQVFDTVKHEDGNNNSDLADAVSFADQAWHLDPESVIQRYEDVASRSRDRRVSFIYEIQR